MQISKLFSLRIPYQLPFNGSWSYQYMTWNFEYTKLIFAKYSLSKLWHDQFVGNSSLHVYKCKWLVESLTTIRASLKPIGPLKGLLTRMHLFKCTCDCFSFYHRNIKSIIDFFFNFSVFLQICVQISWEPEPTKTVLNWALHLLRLDLTTILACF